MPKLDPPKVKVLCPVANPKTGAKCGEKAISLWESGQGIEYLVCPDCWGRLWNRLMQRHK